MLRILILALCLVAAVLPLPLIATALFTIAFTAAAWHFVEAHRDVEDVALRALVPFRAPPSASLR